MSDFIKRYWDGQAEKHGDNHKASWGDAFAIDLEVKEVSEHIEDGDKVLDVGCGPGHSTRKQFELHEIDITGVDYSENMIRNAKGDRKNKKNIDFRVGNILNLPFEDKLFDVVYTTRTLINLPTWEYQKLGINELLRVCKFGGKVVLLEAFYDPLVNLNALRAIAALEPLVEHDFNRYLKSKKLDEFLNNHELVGRGGYTNFDFSSLYYLGSRFVREMVWDYEKLPGYTHKINEIFWKMQKEMGGHGMFGIQQSYKIFRCYE